MPSVNRIMNSVIDIKNKNYVYDTLLSDNEVNEYHNKMKHNEISFSKNITLKNIDFKYEESEDFVLNNFNLTINKGHKIGIIGESGSGKSSLAKILLDFLNQIMEKSSLIIKY